MTIKNMRPWQRRGFYLHACWQFNYPFSVLTWSADDYAGMFGLLRLLDIDTVMLWPMMESIPPPLSKSDAEELKLARSVVDKARASGLECWVVQTANVTSTPAIAEKPLAYRHLYPNKKTVRLDIPRERTEFLAHRKAMMRIVNNADGYVTIDGDPGGYPDAEPQAFVDIIKFDREYIDEIGTHPHEQKVIPWLWCGWGDHWDTKGPWNEPIEPLTQPVITRLKEQMQGPWELLPGRSNTDRWANGRVNFALAEQNNLVDRSMLLLYEIVEFEPCAPACVIQFDSIRRVMRQEGRLATDAIGCMVNAQQPIMALPNLWFFARSAMDPTYLERDTDDILADFAQFLGGDARLLPLAWRSLDLGLVDLPDDLASRLRESQLTSDVAALLPGGPRRYLSILADFVDARVAVLKACSRRPSSIDDLARGMGDGLAALRAWWELHRYVYSGEYGDSFSLRFTNPQLAMPLKQWSMAHCSFADVEAVAEVIASTGRFAAAECASLIDELMA